MTVINEDLSIPSRSDDFGEKRTSLKCLPARQPK